jgi:hypothetical protein
VRNANVAHHGFAQLSAEMRLEQAGGGKVATRSRHVNRGGFLGAVARREQGIVQARATCRASSGLIESSRNAQRAARAWPAAATVQPDGIDVVGQSGRGWTRMRSKRECKYHACHGHESGAANPCDAATARASVAHAAMFF